MAACGSGLIPEPEVCGQLVPGEEAGLFVCGNAHVVHDLVDHVTQEAQVARQEGGFAIWKRRSSIRDIDCVGERATGRKGNMIVPFVIPKAVSCRWNSRPFCDRNQCSKGEAFAKQEIKSLNVLTICRETDRADMPLLSVRTDRPVDMMICQIMKAVKRICSGTG